MSRRPLVSFHGVDIARGIPAAGLAVRLCRRSPDGADLLAEGVADTNGKLVFGPEILGPRDLPCALTVTLDIAAWYGEAASGFIDSVHFNFRLSDASVHYHLPAKITPFGIELFVTRSA